MKNCQKELNRFLANGTRQTACNLCLYLVPAARRFASFCLRQNEYKHYPIWQNRLTPAASGDFAISARAPRGFLIGFVSWLAALKRCRSRQSTSPISALAAHLLRRLRRLRKRRQGRAPLYAISAFKTWYAHLLILRKNNDTNWQNWNSKRSSRNCCWF